MLDFELSNDGKTLIKYHGTSSDVIVPSGVEVIGREAFKQNNFVRRVVLPDGLKRIDSLAFNGCFALESLSIPLSLNSLGIEPFGFAIHLREIRLAEDMKSFPEGAFRNSGIESFDVSKNISIIPRDCFSCCQNLRYIDIPGNVERLCSYSFNWCNSLKKVVVEEGTKVIERRAFYDCHMLGEVYLPESLTSLNPFAFEYCGSLESLHVKWASLPEQINHLENLLEGVNLDQMTLYVPYGTKDLYTKLPQFSQFKYIVEE